MGWSDYGYPLTGIQSFENAFLGLFEALSQRFHILTGTGLDAQIQAFRTQIKTHGQAMRYVDSLIESLNYYDIANPGYSQWCSIAWMLPNGEQLTGSRSKLKKCVDYLGETLIPSPGGDAGFVGPYLHEWFMQRYRCINSIYLIRIFPGYPWKTVTYYASVNKDTNELIRDYQYIRDYSYSVWFGYFQPNYSSAVKYIQVNWPAYLYYPLEIKLPVTLQAIAQLGYSGYTFSDFNIGFSLGEIITYNFTERDIGDDNFIEILDYQSRINACKSYPYGTHPAQRFDFMVPNTYTYSVNAKNQLEFIDE